MAKINELFTLIDDLNRTIAPFIERSDFYAVRDWEGRTSTLVITDDCNLRCTYCYCTKTPLVMTWDIAKKYIDLLFDEAMPFSDIPKEEQTTLKHRKVFEFIGGEPLLQAELMFQCMDYILGRVQELPDTHPWKRIDWPCGCVGNPHPSPGIRFMISTNGVLLNEQWIRDKFLSYNSDYFHIGVTLDGTKEMHDLCRVTPDGQGSYEDVMKAWRWLANHYPHTVTTTKSTISHENIDYIYDIVRFCYDLNLKDLPQNCVFENVWHRGDQLRLFRQLVKVADFLLERERYKKMHVRWFSPTMLTKSNGEGKWCGAGVHMDECDGNGLIYPCLRFKQLKQREPLVMGSVASGIIRTEEWQEKLKATDVNAIYNPRQEDITGLNCDRCPVSGQCGDCQAYAYDCFGSLEAKSPYICPMHKAAAVANLYFFAKLIGSPLDTDYLESLLEEWTATDSFFKD